MSLPCFSILFILIQTLHDSGCVPSSKLGPTTPVSASINIITDSELRSGNLDQGDALVERLLKQEALMGQAKNTKTLVKRFIGFLRLAYPLEMREFLEAAHSRKRRSWRKPKVVSLFKGRRVSCKVTTKMTTPEETTKPVCLCKTPCEYTVVDLEEPDKYRMFFSNPPLCRPTTTVDPMDLVPTTDLCGHSCRCHTEPTTTDNDKEIFIPQTTRTTSCPLSSPGDFAQSMHPEKN